MFQPAEIVPWIAKSPSKYRKSQNRPKGAISFTLRTTGINGVAFAGGAAVTV